MCDYKEGWAREYIDNAIKCVEHLHDGHPERRQPRFLEHLLDRVERLEKVLEAANPKTAKPQEVEELEWERCSSTEAEQHRHRYIGGSIGLEGRWSTWQDGVPKNLESGYRYQFRRRRPKTITKKEYVYMMMEDRTTRAIDQNDFGRLFDHTFMQESSAGRANPKAYRPGDVVDYSYSLPCVGGDIPTLHPLMFPGASHVSLKNSGHGHFHVESVGGELTVVGPTRADPGVAVAAWNGIMINEHGVRYPSK